MAQIITIGRKNWVLGLDWNSYSEKPDTAELKVFADKHSYDWAAVRVNESVIQGGFCAPIDDIKRPKNLASLAAYLADSHEQPWIGVYQISEGLWWYIAVRDGHAILPDGDVIGGREEIREVQEKHAGFGDWNFLKGSIEDLADRINDIDAKRTNLKSLRFKGPTTKQVVCCLAAFVVVAGAAGFYWYQKQVQIEREKQLAAERVKAQLAAGQKIQPEKSPLLDSPTPNAWLKACKDTLYPLPLSVYGWSLDKVTCEESTAIAFWKREAGATVGDRPAGAVSDDGESIIQNISIEGISNATDDDSINLREAALMLRAWAQQVGVMLSIKGNPVPTLPGAQVNEQLPTMPQIPFSLDMKTSPFQLDFAGLPGIRLKSITTNNDDWHVEGIVYGK